MSQKSLAEWRAIRDVLDGQIDEMLETYNEMGLKIDQLEDSFSKICDRIAKDEAELEKQTRRVVKSKKERKPVPSKKPTKPKLVERIPAPIIQSESESEEERVVSVRSKKSSLKKAPKEEKHSTSARPKQVVKYVGEMSTFGSEFEDMY